MICLLFALAGNAGGSEHSVAVVVSDRIKPYLQVLKGLEQGLENHSLGVFYLAPSENKDRLVAGLVKGEYDLFVAIGPEAGQLIWSLETMAARGRIYSAILDPHTTLGYGNGGCGVSLQIPVSTQLAEISVAMPEVKKLGLLFDKTHNGGFFHKARVSGEDFGLEVIALSVDSKKDIPAILKEKMSTIDCIWMVPDRTVISEKIVQYVIKQALYQKKGVIGYNSFFLKSGAVFAFEFDYAQIGLQTSEMVNAYFKGSACVPLVPLYNRGINRKVARTIGLRVKE